MMQNNKNIVFKNQRQKGTIEQAPRCGIKKNSQLHYLYYFYFIYVLIFFPPPEYTPIKNRTRD